MSIGGQLASRPFKFARSRTARVTGRSQPLIATALAFAERGEPFDVLVVDVIVPGE
jgi:hypothetical protein